MTPIGITVAALEDQIEQLGLEAESLMAVADHFRPRFQACWKDGQLVGSVSLTARLQSYVVENRHDAERLINDIANLRAAVALLKSQQAILP
jgi:hypothetical protein